MNVGEPVVGWVEPAPLKKAAVREAITAAVAFSSAPLVVYQFKHDGALFGQDLRVFAFALACLLVLLSGLLGWLAFVYWRASREGWGALHARLDGADVILGNPFNLVPGKKKRFASGDTVKVSVASRRARGKPLSVWTIAGSGGTVVTNGPAPWTHAQWYELVEGLQRLGFTVVAEATPD